MRAPLRVSATVALGLSIAAWLCGCGGGSSGGTPPPPPVAKPAISYGATTFTLTAQTPTTLTPSSTGGAIQAGLLVQR